MKHVRCGDGCSTVFVLCVDICILDWRWYCHVDNVSLRAHDRGVTNDAGLCLYTLDSGGVLGYGDCCGGGGRGNWCPVGHGRTAASPRPALPPKDDVLRPFLHGPIGAPPLVATSGHFDEALVEGEVVSDRILPVAVLQ